MIKKMSVETCVTFICILFVLFFGAWLNFSWNDLEFLQWKSLDEYAFHGVLLKFHSGFLNQDIRSFFAFSFYSYGFIFFLINYIAVAPFISDPSSELLIFIPKMLSTVFFILSLLFLSLILKELKVNHLTRFASFLFILSMPGMWLNLNWFHPDFLMITFLMLSIFFLAKKGFRLESYYDLSITFWAIAIAIKIQAITFAPLFFWLLIEKFINSSLSLKKIKFFLKILFYVLGIYVFLNPYLLHIDGFNAWIANHFAEFSSASQINNDQAIPLSIKLKFGIFDYFFHPVILIFVSAFSLFFIIRDIYKREFTLIGALSLTLILNNIFLIFFLNKGWNHYFLPVIFLSSIILFFTLNKIRKGHLVQIFTLSIIIMQGYNFSSDLKKIVTNRFQQIVISRDSIYNYNPTEYSLEELRIKTDSIYNFLKDRVDESSSILSSAYIGLPLKKLGLRYDQIKIIYGDISESDLIWFISAEGANNYLLIKKINSEKFISNFSQMILPYDLRLIITDENSCCFLIKI